MSGTFGGGPLGGPRDGIIKEGWLRKQSKFLKDWRRRWFVLTSQCLCSYKSSDVHFQRPTEVSRRPRLMTTSSPCRFTLSPCLCLRTCLCCTVPHLSLTLSPTFLPVYLSLRFLIHWFLTVSVSPSSPVAPLPAHVSLSTVFRSCWSICILSLLLSSAFCGGVFLSGSVRVFRCLCARSCT